MEKRTRRYNELMRKWGSWGSWNYIVEISLGNWNFLGGARI